MQIHVTSLNCTNRNARDQSEQTECLFSNLLKHFFLKLSHIYHKIITYIK